MRLVKYKWEKKIFCFLNFFCVCLKYIGVRFFFFLVPLAVFMYKLQVRIAVVIYKEFQLGLMFLIHLCIVTVTETLPHSFKPWRPMLPFSQIRIAQHNCGRKSKLEYVYFNNFLLLLSEIYFKQGPGYFITDWCILAWSIKRLGNWKFKYAWRKKFWIATWK